VSRKVKSINKPVRNDAALAPVKAVHSVTSFSFGSTALVALAAVDNGAPIVSRRKIATEELQQMEILRDIAGNPFRPVTFSPCSRTATVTNLAQTIYDDRQLPSGLFDNQRMTVLADALEEAGCDNKDILDHCRSGGEHVRGCWVVDLVLGKE